jgi:DNA-binding transcriptional LysR family regulator
MAYVCFVGRKTAGLGWWNWPWARFTHAFALQPAEQGWVSMEWSAAGLGVGLMSDRQVAAVLRYIEKSGGVVVVAEPAEAALRQAGVPGEGARRARC